MTHKMVSQTNGTLAKVLRSDAIRHDGRYFVPTSNETKWVDTWEGFLAAGGVVCFNEGQTEIELLLPEPYKFGCGFMRPKQ